MVLAVLVPSIVLSMINVPSNDAATVPNYHRVACLRCGLLCAATPPQLRRSVAGLLFDFTSDRNDDTRSPNTPAIVVGSQ